MVHKLYFVDALRPTVELPPLLTDLQTQSQPRQPRFLLKKQTPRPAEAATSRQNGTGKKKKKRCRARWPHTCCGHRTSKLLQLHKANSEPSGLQGFSTLPTGPQPSPAQPYYHIPHPRWFSSHSTFPPKKRPHDACIALPISSFPLSFLS